MSFNHAVIWIDHREAHLIHFSPEAYEKELIKTKSSHSHLHHKSGSASGTHAVSDHGYLHAVVEAAANAREILIVGPGSAKLELMKHITKHDHALLEKIVGVETVDHPSDGQLLAFAKKYFIKIDNMKGDSVIG
ncbi:MAG: translational machinery protein [Polynucleobacter sp.]|nr:translational machinery protein [Polynucleobacter sp.]